ncbi:hypothetical protein [Streptomyces sp. NPDC056296]
MRHTGDAHHGTGVAHGDDVHEHGGFAVHFEECELPRRLWRVTQTLPRYR